MKIKTIFLVGVEKMNLSESVIEAIKHRTSIRTYKSEKLSKELKDKLKIKLEAASGPFNKAVKFVIIDKEDKSSEGLKLGTYGVIKGAQSFIACSTEKSDEALIELGYKLEEVVLYATALGIGTVWLGGTFNKSEFAKAIKLKEGEILPIIMPIGIPAEKRGLTEKLMRFVSGGDNRKEFNTIFFYDSFNRELKKEEAKEYLVPLEMLRLAPSAVNKQPWRIVMMEEEFQFFLQHSKGHENNGVDIQKVDMGIAMKHFEAAAKELKLKGHWEKRHFNTNAENIEYIISWIKD